MSNIDKRGLREAAEKATPGRIGDRVDGSIKYTCRGTDGTLVLSTDNHDDYGFVGDNSLEDELFFRLCDPVTVLVLLDELEAKDKLNAELMEKQRLIDICQGQGLEYRIAAENRAETAEKRIAELEARQPYGYLRENDGQIQISIGSNRPHDRSGGYATPWFAIYTAAGIGVKGE